MCSYSDIRSERYYPENKCYECSIDLPIYRGGGKNTGYCYGCIRKYSMITLSEELSAQMKKKENRYNRDIFWIASYLHMNFHRM